MMTNKQNKSLSEVILLEEERFLSDSTIKFFNDMIDGIYTVVVPTCSIWNGKLEQAYDSRTQELVDKIISRRDEYIKRAYVLLIEAYKIQIERDNDTKDLHILICPHCEESFDLESLSKNEWGVESDYIIVQCPYCGGVSKILANI